jgi:hypothetical protein
MQQVYLHLLHIRHLQQQHSWAIFHSLKQTHHFGSVITQQQVTFCKDKSLFTGDLVPSIFEVGSATGILTPTFMGTVTLWLTDDEGVFHSFELTNVHYLQNSPMNLLLRWQLAEDATDHPDWHSTGIWSVFDDHLLILNRNQFKKIFMTASSGLPERLFNSGYSQ